MIVEENMGMRLKKKKKNVLGFVVFDEISNTFFSLQGKARKEG